MVCGSIYFRMAATLLRKGTSMKRVIALAWILMTVCALPANAGEGTIEETETAIIVEYTGDAKDLPASTAGQEIRNGFQKIAPEGLHAATPEAAQQAPAKSDMSAQEARNNMSEVQRKKLETRAATQSARQQRMGESTRQPRSESEQ
jgi:hypothetical protein